MTRSSRRRYGTKRRPSSESDSGAGAFSLSKADHRTKPQLCLQCGALLDAATGFEDAAPKPGAAMLCIHCGYVMILGEDLSFRKPTPEEASEIDNDLRVQIGRLAISQLPRLPVRGERA